MSTAATGAGLGEPTAEVARRPGLDWGLLLTAVALAGYGLLAILSASSLDAEAVYDDPFHFVTRQVVGLAVGGLVAAAVVAAPYAWLRRSAWPVWLGAVVLLVAVLTPLGHSAKGATRWIAFGPINVQPAEIAKVALVAVLADYLANNRGRLADVVGVGLPGLGLLLPLVVLVIFQKDFGTTVILLGLAGVLFFAAGLQWRWMVGGGLATASLLGFLVVVEPYRIRRLVSFLDPFADPDDAGYQVVQGWIALATGGLFGSGLASGVAQRGFLPEPHTDFVSAVVGEELGAFGWLLVVGLTTALVWRAARIATRAPDLFGMLAATGIAALFGAQAIINLGVVCGMLPAKGLVLPFLSYGASAVVVHAACVGVLLKIGLVSTPPTGSS
jgi:cell division protein FtsW